MDRFTVGYDRERYWASAMLQAQKSQSMMHRLIAMSERQERPMSARRKLLARLATAKQRIRDAWMVLTGAAEIDRGDY